MPSQIETPPTSPIFQVKVRTIYRYVVAILCGLAVAAVLQTAVDCTAELIGHGRWVRGLFVFGLYGLIALIISEFGLFIVGKKVK